MSPKKTTKNSGKSNNPVQTPQYVMDEVKLLLSDVSTPESAVEFDSRPKTIPTTQRSTPASIRDSINPPWTWANQTARNAQQVTQDDLGKIGYQKDTDTYYQLTGAVPVVWSPVPNPGDTSSPLELSTGASDATSYHDFFRLQIAFEDVWAEMLDQNVKNLGEQLYAKWDALMEATQGPDVSPDRYDDSGVADRQKHFSLPVDANGNPLAITGVEQLSDFLNYLKTVLGISSSGSGSTDNSTQVSALRDNLVQTLRACKMLLGAIRWAGGGGWGDDQIFTGQIAATDVPHVIPGANPYVNDLADFPNVTRQQVFDNLINTVKAIAPSQPPSSTSPTDDFAISDITKLLTQLDAALKERYRFDVFAPASINYGLLLNYRQRWQPQSYQVGNLVSTIPLAPQETRRYTTKTVIKKTRNIKEIDESLRTGKDESSNTWRLDAEIVDRAKNQTNFQTNAKGSYGADDLYKVEAGMQGTNDQAVESAQTKREFHESVFKSAQEYRNERRLEISTEESREAEATSYREIRNPNDELTVTYLFYELQRRYLVDESLYKATPVLLVANDVPAPHEVDQSWILRHDWIIKRAILDDSFLPALEYLSANYVGEEIKLETLQLAVQQQKEVVDRLSQQVSLANQSLDAATAGLVDAQAQDVNDLKTAETVSMVKSIFDPLGITGSQKVDDGNSDRARMDFAKDALNRAQAKVNQLVGDMKSEMTALQVAIDKYTAAATHHFSMLADIERLRLHVKDNIIYYMQAIWTYEPPDQRYFRLYNLDVPVFEHHTSVHAVPKNSGLARIDTGSSPFNIVFPPPTLSTQYMKLHEVADLDTLIGFKGNYMIFPLVNFDNYMAWYLMQHYIHFDDAAGLVAADPDPDADLTLEDLQAAMAQIAKVPTSFATLEPDFEEVMFRLLSKQTPQMVIVPSNSLYVEALPGTHPLLEDFKLIHRAIDIKKAQAEARKAELENLRLAARLANGELGDPDVDKVVVVGGGKNVTVDAGQ